MISALSISSVVTGQLFIICPRIMFLKSRGEGRPTIPYARRAVFARSICRFVNLDKLFLTVSTRLTAGSFSKVFVNFLFLVSWKYNPPGLSSNTTIFRLGLCTMKHGPCDQLSYVMRYSCRSNRREMTFAIPPVSNQTRPLIPSTVPYVVVFRFPPCPWMVIPLLQVRIFWINLRLQKT